MKVLNVNYAILNGLSLADEIALLQFQASILDAMNEDLGRFGMIANHRPLDIKENKELTDLQEKIEPTVEIVKVLNNRVSHIVNSIFSWDEQTSQPVDKNPLTEE